MTRCDYDSIFYRVFCVTLLAIAFTFTVILTNVFIDIDGILAKKDNVNLEKIKAPTTQPQEKEVTESYHAKKIDPELIMKQEQMESKANFYGVKPERKDDEENYRTKRSLDTQNFQFHVKNPKMKQILNNRLATLLEELDAEETHHVTSENKPKEEEPSKTGTLNAVKKPLDEDKSKMEIKDNNLLHLAMHNILLQGIIGHMDLNDVYKKVHNLVNNFEENNAKKSTSAPGKGFRAQVEVFRRSSGSKSNQKEVLHQEHHQLKPELSQETVSSPPSLFSVESKFFEELVKCDELQKQIYNSPNFRMVGNGRRSGSLSIAKKYIHKAPKVLIRTVIDIKTPKNKNDSKTTYSSNDIKGIIKLIYNGQPIQVSDMEDYQEEKEHRQTDDHENMEAKPDNETHSSQDLQDESGKIVDNFLDSALAQYLRKYPELATKYKNKRLKRQAKIKHVVLESNETTKTKDDGEFYVQIETHINAKGIKDDKKKKLIQAIVEKIKNAISTSSHNQTESSNKTIKPEKQKFMKIKKRLQNPLETQIKHNFFKKIILPLSSVIRREVNPIVNFVNPLPSMANVQTPFGRMTKKDRFLSNSKAINSGEAGKVDLDYNLVLKDNGVPQRLQQPLNSENVAEIPKDDNFFDGDLKFYVKEFDGSGFSIGFNQYVAEAPDPNSIKLFTGLQQLIAEYHKKYNKNNGNVEENKEPKRIHHDVRKRDADKGDLDFHSNEYKVIFDHNLLPYDSYSQVMEDSNKKISFSIEKESSFQHNNTFLKEKSPFIPLVFDENLFKKQLKPSEIFGIASLLERKKRSPIKVQRVSNLKTRSRINRYINTGKISERKSFKRSKRQIDKIRIIATDTIPRVSKGDRSEENIFVVSDENMFANRAVVPDPETADQENEQEEGNEFVIPHHLSIQSFHQMPRFNPYDIFNARSRHNSLMAKYPHIFLEEVAHSKEENNPLFYTKLIDNYADMVNSGPTAPPFLPTPIGLLQPQHEVEFSDSSFKLTPENEPKQNYKLTVKITPKNHSEIHSGFKEIHTSINKSMNKNGLLYSSQVNVTELSKIENLKENPLYKYLHPPPAKDTESTPESTNNYLSFADLNDTLVAVATGKDPGRNFPLMKEIREQQEKMKVLLNQHKNHIDEQLNNLKLAKLNIDSILIPPEEKKPIVAPEKKKQETIDVALPSNPQQMLRLNKDEAVELISIALMKLHSASQSNDISGNNFQQHYKTNMQQQSLITEQQQPLNILPETTTATTPSHPTIEPIKRKILNSIQKNENLTNVILCKIDRNTNMLQRFLEKLSERMEPLTRRGEEPPESKPEWNINDQLFNKALPNLAVRKNATHVSIPFVYAYQQPYTLPNKSNSPVASIVYQGHIHTNAYNDVNKGVQNNFLADVKNTISDKREANRSTYFLDDNEGEFKIHPIPFSQKLYGIPRTKNNVTKLYSKANP